MFENEDFDSKKTEIIQETTRDEGPIFIGIITQFIQELTEDITPEAYGNKIMKFQDMFLDATYIALGPSTLDRITDIMEFHNCAFTVIPKALYSEEFMKLTHDYFSRLSSAMLFPNTKQEEEP